MSKLVDLLKYESGADVIPGFFRVLYKNIPSKSDYVNAYRTLVRCVTLVAQVETLRDTPQSAQSDNCQMPLWLAYLIALGITEAMKYGADRATTSIAHRLIKDETQSDIRSLESQF